MDIAVIYSSHHGSTQRIAEIIAGDLETAGHLTYLESVTAGDAAAHLGDADAVVLGSAVYLEKWTPEMTHFVIENAERLAPLPVATFSVGLTGEHPRPEVDLEPVATALIKGRLPDGADWGYDGTAAEGTWTSAHQFARELPGKFDARRA